MSNQFRTFTNVAAWWPRFPDSSCFVQINLLCVEEKLKSDVADESYVADESS